MPNEDPQVGEIYSVSLEQIPSSIPSPEPCPGIVTDVSSDRVTLINPNNGVRVVIARKTFTQLRFHGEQSNMYGGYSCYIAGCTRLPSLGFFRYGVDFCPTCYLHAPVGVRFLTKFIDCVPYGTVPAQNCPKCSSLATSEDFWNELKDPWNTPQRWCCRTCSEGWASGYCYRSGRVPAHSWSDPVVAYRAREQISYQIYHLGPIYLSRGEALLYLKDRSPWDFLSTFWLRQRDENPRQIIHLQTPNTAVGEKWGTTGITSGQMRTTTDLVTDLPPKDLTQTLSCASIYLGTPQTVFTDSLDNFLTSSMTVDRKRDNGVPIALGDEFTVPKCPKDPVLKIIEISPHGDGFRTAERGMWVYYSTQAIQQGIIVPLKRKSAWDRLLEEDPF